MSTTTWTVTHNGALVYKQPYDGSVQYQIMNPKLKMELDKAGSFTFSVYKGQDIFETIAPMSSIIEVKRNDEILYHGRVLTVSRGMDGNKDIVCQGILSYLLDSLASPKDVQVISPHTFLSDLINEHNSCVSSSQKKFYIGNVDIQEYNTSKQYAKRSSYATVKDLIQDEFINSYGAHLYARRTSDGKNYIDILTQFGAAPDQQIELGQNLISMNTQSNGQGIFTVLLPLGKDQLTIQASNNGNKYLTNQTAVNKYGRILKVQEFSECQTSQALKDKAISFMSQQRMGQILTSATITALDFANVDNEHNPFKLGYKINVSAERAGMQGQLVCTSIEIPLQEPQKAQYSLSIPQCKKQYNETSVTTANASASHSGGGGGGGGSSSNSDLITKLLSYIQIGNVNIRGLSGEVQYTNEMALNLDKVKINAADVQSLYAKKAYVETLIADQVQARQAQFNHLTSGVTEAQKLLAKEMSCYSFRQTNSSGQCMIKRRYADWKTIHFKSATDNSDVTMTVLASSGTYSKDQV